MMRYYSEITKNEVFSAGDGHHEIPAGHCFLSPPPADSVMVFPVTGLPYLRAMTVDELANVNENGLCVTPRYEYL